MNSQELPLRDLHLPTLTGWWPLAPGVWVLIIVIVVATVLLLRRAYRRWQHNRSRRIALESLAVITSQFKSGADAVTLGKEISELIRRTMLAYAPREDIAGLTGNEWLEWLDRGLDERLFSEGTGKILESLPYRDPQQVDNDEDVRGLISAVRTRLQNPLSDTTKATRARVVGQTMTPPNPKPKPTARVIG